MYPLCGYWKKYKTLNIREYLKIIILKISTNQNYFIKVNKKKVFDWINIRFNTTHTLKNIVLENTLK